MNAKSDVDARCRRGSQDAYSRGWHCPIRAQTRCVLAHGQVVGVARSIRSVGRVRAIAPRQPSSRHTAVCDPRNPVTSGDSRLSSSALLHGSRTVSPFIEKADPTPESQGARSVGVLAVVADPQQCPGDGLSSGAYRHLKARRFVR